MPLGTDVGLDPGHIVFEEMGSQLPSPPKWPQWGKPQISPTRRQSEACNFETAQHIDKH